MTAKKSVWKEGMTLGGYLESQSLKEDTMPKKYSAKKHNPWKNLVVSDSMDSSYKGYLIYNTKSGVACLRKKVPIGGLGIDDIAVSIIIENKGPSQEIPIIKISYQKGVITTTAVNPLTVEKTFINHSGKDWAKALPILENNTKVFDMIAGQWNEKILNQLRNKTDHVEGNITKQKIRMRGFRNN